MIHRPRALLADDHVMLLDAFKSLLRAHCDIVGTASNGRDLIELAGSTLPDLIILDISMPELNGLQACAQIREKNPSIKCIFLTVSEDPCLAAEAIRIGASGFLLKHSAAEELITAIDIAMANRLYVTPLITKDKTLKEFIRGMPKLAISTLTARQRQVLTLLAEGKKMKEAAEILHVTPRTIAFHKYTIMDQLGVKTSAELIHYALEHHLLTPQG